MLFGIRIVTVVIFCAGCFFVRVLHLGVFFLYFLALINIGIFSSLGGVFHVKEGSVSEHSHFRLSLHAPHSFYA